MFLTHVKDDTEAIVWDVPFPMAKRHHAEEYCEVTGIWNVHFQTLFTQPFKNHCHKYGSDHRKPSKDSTLPRGSQSQAFIASALFGTSFFFL